jgi:hypothetical protein
MAEAMSGSHRDSIGFTAELLGKSKSAAQNTGHKLVLEFQEIDRHIEQLREHGISIASVRFENPVVQAAWIAHNQGLSGPPLPFHEDEIVLSVTEHD